MFAMWWYLLYQLSQLQPLSNPSSACSPSNFLVNFPAPRDLLLNHRPEIHGFLRSDLFQVTLSPSKWKSLHPRKGHLKEPGSCLFQVAFIFFSILNFHVHLISVVFFLCRNSRNILWHVSWKGTQAKTYPEASMYGIFRPTFTIKIN